METAANFGPDLRTGSAQTGIDLEAVNENGPAQKGLSPDGFAEHSATTSLLLSRMAPLGILLGTGASPASLGRNSLVPCLSTAN